MKAILFLMALLLAAPIAAAPACSTETSTCYTSWKSEQGTTQRCNGTGSCNWKGDATGESPLLQTDCPSGRVFQQNSTIAAEVYSCTGSTYATDCTRYRALNEAGTFVDATLDAMTPRLEGGGQALWMFNVTSGSGTIQFNCGG